MHPQVDKLANNLLTFGRSHLTGRPFFILHNMATKVVQPAIQIKAPNFQVLEVEIIGTAPFMQARFSQKSMLQMADKMKAGSTSTGKKVRTARDFDEDFEQAKHISMDGWVGIPASAFRSACIRVCSLVGFKMTQAKMSIFFEADGEDKVDGIPLVKLIAGEPEKSMMATRNATGVADLRCRPLWRKWGAKLRVKFDADQFTAQDVINLVHRAGVQCGVGEGRPFSKDSNGLGYGTFTIKN